MNFSEASIAGLPSESRSVSSSATCAAPAFVRSDPAHPHIVRLSLSIRRWSRRRSQEPARSLSRVPRPTTDEESLWRNLAFGTVGAPRTRCDLRDATVAPKVRGGWTPDRQGRRLRKQPGTLPEPALAKVPLRIAFASASRGNRQTQFRHGAEGNRSLHQQVLRGRPAPRPHQRRAGPEESRDRITPLSTCLNDSSALRGPYIRPSHAYPRTCHLEFPNFRSLTKNDDSSRYLDVRQANGLLAVSVGPAPVVGAPVERFYGQGNPKSRHRHCHAFRALLPRVWNRAPPRGTKRIFGAIYILSWVSGLSAQR